MAMRARISTTQGDAGKIDDAVKLINEKIIPALKGMQGFAAINFLADRSAGKLVTVAFYDDEAALEGSVEAVGPMRTEIANAMDDEVVGVESYELVAQSW
ncbi:MAG: hypothetical protein ACYC6Z_11145 [Thermoleophilia bacterium]